MSDKLELKAGDVFAVWYPFKRETFTKYDEEGGVEVETWNPGWRYESSGPEDVEPRWDGEGEQIRTVVSVHKPGKYPERVFYTRQYRDPSGKVFGKTNLRMISARTFREWTKGSLRADLLDHLTDWRGEPTRSAKQFFEMLALHEPTKVLEPTQ